MKTMLRLYNTLAERKEDFKPLKKQMVKIFTCGPSIYQPPHIGNYRTFLYEDLLVRYLRYRGFEVERAIILTDIEDKALMEAEKRRMSVKKITDENAKRFFNEAKALSIDLPKRLARSSTTVDFAIAIILRLLKNGVAYRHGNNIYFDVHAFPEFGKLFKIDTSSWPKKKVRFSRDTYNGRRWNRGDFILWHGASQNDELSFDAPFGAGRPSWNVQDPAAVMKHLGEQIDINCGGIDNLYRHHDYNIAVMEAATGKPFARYYLHGEHLLVNGKTMSKSRGNIIYPDDLYQKGFKPHHLRFFLLSKHYRKKLNYSEEDFLRQTKRIDEARKIVRIIFSARLRKRNSMNEIMPNEMLLRKFSDAMDDDLNFPEAFANIAAHIESIAKNIADVTAEELRGIRKAIQKIDSVMKVLL